MLYFVNTQAQTSGDHEVHEEGCQFLPGNCIRLGEHADCASAVTMARRLYPRSNGCYHCCRECHTG